MTAERALPEAGRPLKQRWTAGEAWLGVWATLGDAISAEIVARCGFDFVVTDLQHGYATMESIRPVLDAVHAAGAGSLVRVAWNRPELIMRALDLGADGIVVPMVETAPEALIAANACRYAPSGTRSWGAMRSGTRGVPVQPGVDDHNAVCVLMIETAAGLANVVEIVRTPGVDAVYVGPNDLALSLDLGRSGYDESETLRTAIRAVVDAAHDAGILAGVDCPTERAVRYWRDAGADFTIAASDGLLLTAAAAGAATALRAAGAS